MIFVDDLFVDSKEPLQEVRKNCVVSKKTLNHFFKISRFFLGDLRKNKKAA